MKKRGKTLKQRMDEIISTPQPETNIDIEIKRKVFFKRIHGSSSASIDIAFWLLSKLPKRLIDFSEFDFEAEGLLKYNLTYNLDWFVANNFMQRKYGKLYILNDIFCNILELEKKEIIELKELKRSLAK